MDRGLERGRLSVARRRLYRSGQRLDPLVRSATMDGDSQVSGGGPEGRILSGCRARALTEPVRLCSPSFLRCSIYYPPALADQLDPVWAGLKES